ncbi:DegT/DnrJ/EryC1/StrS family aminotransferase [candidate division WS5 bacterium]|uniref:DegT/DnrJ/EryC1/StrS family aminotransferase n=1 Tax=candidate division WS5 bacterium TaxID=2093353 RepID=A0A419D9R1_9BACT|nr:MAG: DegT/DnrJ/EryC1/StrS family aminotransferase [candidate division WS5 bacterium]
MMIKSWDYLKEYENEKHEIHAAIEKVLSSGRLILGESVKNFEEAFAKYCGVKYGIGVNSGTDAIFLGLKALGIRQGDEVITVANTAVPTVSSIVAAGATPVFVDIDPDTYLMDTSLLEEAISERTKCILPVHLYGQCVDMDKLNRIASARGLKVIEDCAQSHGASFNGRKAGSMSELAAFSFYPTKVLGGYGDSGMVVTNDKRIYERIRRLRFYGMEQTYYAEEIGYNSRLDELHAEILLRKLTHIDSYITRRKELAGRYDRHLSETGITLPKTLTVNEHVYHLYVCRHPERDKIISRLKANDIAVGIHYPWPIHTMKGYQYLGYKPGDIPHTEKAADEIFSLPMYPSLTDDEQEIVLNELQGILQSLHT